MISIVTVYNDEKILKENLLKSLEKQSTKYELIPIDNTQKTFESASKALNYGGGLARGDYIMFVHQDVQLMGDDWLERCERICKNISENGILGSVGVTKTGRLINTGIDATFLHPSCLLEEVQVLDEQLLVVSKALFGNFTFDETFNDWHCYAADYCLSLQKQNIKSLVFNLPVFHNSPRTNPRSNLKKEQIKLWQKHGNDYTIICTSCGIFTPHPMISMFCNVFLKLQFVKGFAFFSRYILSCYIKVYDKLKNIKWRL